MPRPSRPLLAVLLALALAGGCVRRNRPAKSDPGRQPPRAVDASRDPARDPARVSPSMEPSPAELTYLALRVYTIRVPFGEVSRNREFWRRIDEQSVDPGTYDVLWANGVRVGGAPVSELSHLEAVLGSTRADRMDLVARQPGRQSRELPLAGNVGETTLFWFDAAKRHQGRTFQNCEAALALAFEPTPGRTQSARVSLTPVVRSRSPRIVVTPHGDDYTVTESKETTLLDLRLKADVPIGEFLVVAPSDELGWETSVGRQFFCREAGGELWETVYVIVPMVGQSRPMPDRR